MQLLSAQEEGAVCPEDPVAFHIVGPRLQLL